MSENKVGKRVKVTIEKIVSGGDGLAHLSDGRVVFVSGGLPGEEVVIRLTQCKHDFARAVIDTLITPSEIRGEPKCSYYGICGGCDLQHVKDTHQIEMKRAVFRDTMARIGSIDVDSLDKNYQVVPGPLWEYRTRAKFHIDKQHRRAGFLGKNTSDVVDIQMCPILDHRLNQLLSQQKESWFSLPAHKEAAAQRKRQFSHHLHTIQTVAGDDGAVIEETTTVQTIAPKYLPSRKFVINGEVFFQSNQIMLSSLLDDLFSDLSGSKAMDLFSGVGTFAAFLQDRYDQVIAVERDRRCLQFAEKNLDLHKVLFYSDTVENWIKNKGEFGIDLIVVDPPRTGLPSSVVDIMLSWRPKKIIYISCNPVTLARDLKIMLRRGYHIDKMRAYDFYPQTTHLEAAAVIVRDSML